MRVPRAGFTVERLPGPAVRLSGSGDPVYLEPGRILRWRRPRMTIRLLIVAVMVVALGLWVEKMSRLSAYYRGLANTFSTECIPTCYVDTALSTDEIKDWEQRFRKHRDMMRKKYDRAARYPWLPVEPNPPEPQ
jgi:hypothetical protein